MEVIVGSQDKRIYCLDGSTGIVEWAFITGGLITSSPVLGNVDSDSKLEVLIGSWDGKVYCLDGATGKEDWTFTTGSLIVSSAALGDVDGDGDMEVLIGSWDMIFYCLDGSSGDQEWVFQEKDKIGSPPALGDVDGDGKMEIIIGSYDNDIDCLVGNGDPWAIPGPWPCMGGSALHHSNADDTDGDNLPDILEISLGLNEYNSDTDGDEYSDSEEIRANSDPLDFDSIPFNWTITIIIIVGSILGITTIVSLIIIRKNKTKTEKIMKTEPTFKENETEKRDPDKT